MEKPAAPCNPSFSEQTIRRPEIPVLLFNPVPFYGLSRPSGVSGRMSYTCITVLLRLPFDLHRSRVEKIPVVHTFII